MRLTKTVRDKIPNIGLSILFSFIMILGNIKRQEGGFFFLSFGFGDLLVFFVELIAYSPVQEKVQIAIINGL